MIPATFSVARAVILPLGEAAVLLQLARRYELTLAKTGSRLNHDTALIVGALHLAVQELSTPTDGPTVSGGRTSVSHALPLPFSVHDLVSTVDAAALLGCTAANVRDLARRGVLPGRLWRNRWFLEAEGVHARAEHRARSAA